MDWLASSYEGSVQLIWTRQVVSAPVRHRYVDTTPPAIEVTFAPDGGGGWYKTSPATGNVVVTDDLRITAITCTDALGGLTQGPLAGGGTASASRTLSVAGDGSHSITCTATDATGHSASVSVAVRVDTTPPVITGLAQVAIADRYRGVRVHCS